MNNKLTLPEFIEQGYYDKINWQGRELLSQPQKVRQVYHLLLKNNKYYEKIKNRHYITDINWFIEQCNTVLIKRMKKAPTDDEIMCYKRNGICEGCHINNYVTLKGKCQCYKNVTRKIKNGAKIPEKSSTLSIPKLDVYQYIIGESEVI